MVETAVNDHLITTIRETMTNNELKTLRFLIIKVNNVTH